MQNAAAYMVTEFVDGETVHAMIARRGPIPAAEAVPLFCQALVGIRHAHRFEAGGAGNRDRVHIARAGDCSRTALLT